MYRRSSEQGKPGLPCGRKASRATASFSPHPRSPLLTPCACGCLACRQTFHGGRLGELAGAAVLFSAHGKSMGGGASAGCLGREGFLGQASQPNAPCCCCASPLLLEKAMYQLYLWIAVATITTQLRQQQLLVPLG